MFSRITHLLNPTTGPEKRVSQRGLNFRVGDIFSGRVVRRYSGGDVIVSARGRQFRASTVLDLGEGEKHTFQVKSSGEGIELKVLDGEVLRGQSPLQLWASSRMARDRLITILSDLAASRNMKNLPPEAGTALRDLSRHFPTMVYREPSAEGARWLTSALLGSGLFLENKVARCLLGEKPRPWKKILSEDLKGLLLTLEQTMSGGEPELKPWDPLLLKIREALHLIEQEQMLNLCSLKEGVGWFWFIPGLKENGLTRAEVFAGRDPSQEGIRFSLFLELSRLGAMEAEIFAVASHVDVKIWLDEEKKADFVNRHLPLLAEALQESGMRPASLSCGVRERTDLNPFGDGRWAVPSIHVVI